VRAELNATQVDLNRENLELAGGNGPAEADDATAWLSRAVMVVAHPDDEVLWLSSALAAVHKVIFCFNDYPAVPELGAGRTAAIAQYPLTTAQTLDVAESGSFDFADWSNPEPTRYGLQLRAPNSVRRTYEATFETLIHRLDPILSTAPVVLTHNPWGEYGHEDHVQVYRAVKALQSRYGFELWYSNYASNRSWPLMMMHLEGFDHRYRTLNTNATLAGALGRLYQQNRCWTWYKDYRWPETETLLRDGPIQTNVAVAGRGGNFPVQALRVDFRRPDGGKTRLRNIWARLGRRR